MLSPVDPRRRRIIRDSVRVAAQSTRFECVQLLGFDWRTRATANGPLSLGSSGLGLLEILQSRMCYRAILYVNAERLGVVRTHVLDIGGDEVFSLRFVTPEWRANWTTPSETTADLLRRIAKR